MHVVREMSAHGWQSARLERLEAVRAELGGAFWPRQYSNPGNPAAYRTLATELLADLRHVDILVGAVGSGGSLCGTARALRQEMPGLRVVGVDCVGSVLFGQPDQPGRLQSGLGNSLVPANLDYSQIDEVHWLNDLEAFSATRRLAAEQQIFGGNTSGSVYLALRHVTAMADADVVAVGIFPDRGDRYAGTVYDDQHWERHGLDLDGADVRSEPERVSFGTPVSSWSCSAVPARTGGATCPDA